MKNKLLISAVVGSLFALQSCKPEEITPNEVNATGSINLNGTIYANANESDDFITGVRFSNNPGDAKRDVRIHKEGDYAYWYEHLAFPNEGFMDPVDRVNTGCITNQGIPTTGFFIPRVLGVFGNPVGTASILPSFGDCNENYFSDTVMWDGSTLNQSFDIFNFMERKGQKVSGVVVTAQYSTEDIASWTADTIQYPMQVVTTTTDANGRYSLSIPAAGKSVFVIVSVGGKTLDHIYVNESDIIETATNVFLTEPLYYSASDYITSLGLAPGIPGNSNTYSLDLNAGASVTQNFILTPQ